MATVPPRGSALSSTAETECPYVIRDPAGALKCGAYDVVGEYLPELVSGYQGDMCLDTAGTWLDCFYFKRAMLL
jgi:hypothetical protein